MFKRKMVQVTVGGDYIEQAVHALLERERMLNGRLKYEVVNDLPTEETAVALGHTRGMLETLNIAYQEVK